METLYKLSSRKNKGKNKMTIRIEIENQKDVWKIKAVMKKAIRKLNHLFRNDFTYQIHIGQVHNHQEERRNQ